MNFDQRDNCFTWIEDLEKAQELAQKQLQTQWPETLKQLVKREPPNASENL